MTASERLLLLCALSIPALAQWENIKSPGIPRLADGKPNLSAPAPKNSEGKPDLTGIWRHDNTLRDEANGVGFERFLPKGERIPLLPAAASLILKDHADPSERCLPDGTPEHMLPGIPIKIVQTPGLTLVLYEEFYVFRQIFSDGRKLPRDPNPAFFGYSVAHWEGNQFVVESTGFNDTVWLDKHPHGPSLKTIERYERLNSGHLRLNFTVDDPQYYARPWTVTFNFNLFADDELIEHFCENEKDLSHMVRQ